MASTMKTYNDSYLYKTKVLKTQKDNPNDKANKALQDFIINAHRIEVKNSDQFRGIVEEVKRSQRTSCLYSVLMMDNVKLCINSFELPRAFKVFDAKDIKNGGKPAVFIDVTGLIELRNGYYTCKKLDVLLAYLFDALIYLVYRYNREKLVDNSSITLAATECYVSMFNFIIDYSSVIGYSNNKNKISYLAAIFFLHTMCGKDINDYTKSIAAKICGSSQQEAKAYSLYIDDKDDTFDNIATFITYISDRFTLKGFDLQVFVSKWMYLFGTGTEYACELYTSFMVLIANAYSGSYIVQQRQIERACKANMVKVCLEIERVGVSLFTSAKGFGESTELEVHDKNTRELANSIVNRENASEYLKINESDFHVLNCADVIAKDSIKFCNETRMNNKISTFAENVVLTGLKSAYESSYNILTDDDVEIYESGALLAATKVFKGSFTDKQRYNIESVINKDIEVLRELIRESELEKETLSSVSKVISEMMEVKQYL